MRIVCPSCQAAYEVPETLLGGTPRKVRCARCATAWTPAPEAAAPEATAPKATTPAPEPSEPPLPEPEPPPRPAPPPPVVPRAEQKLAPPPPPPRRSLAMLAALAWAVSLAVLAGAGWAAIAWRADIMALWAPSRRLFGLLGMG